MSNRKMHNEVSKVCLLLSLGAEHDIAISRYLPPWDGFLFPTASGFRNYLPLKNVVNGILFSFSGLSKMTTNGIVTKWNLSTRDPPAVCDLLSVNLHSLGHACKILFCNTCSIFQFPDPSRPLQSHAKRFVKSSKTFDKTFTVGW